MTRVPCGDANVDSVTSRQSRAQRLFGGWSANLVQVLLGITQQIALIPVFLHYWSSEILAGWLVIYAAGNLAFVADMGLQARAINRFLSFRSSADCNGRTAAFYCGMLRIYLVLSAVLIALLLAGCALWPPSVTLGFEKLPHFDTAFVAMVAGIFLLLPSGLITSLYRARGLYGRVVQRQNWGTLIAQLGQLVAVVTTGSLLAVVLTYVTVQSLTSLWFLTIDGPRLFPYLRRRARKPSWRWVRGQFGGAAPFAVANMTELALVNLPVLLVSAFVTDRVAVAQWGLTRVAAGLLRSLCIQASLPLSAELGEDHSLGKKERLRHLYARGSVFVTLLASAAVSALLPFWQDFFALWTHGSIPYDPALTFVLLIGAGLVAPSLLALGFANYSNQGELLARSKGLQLAVFLVLSLLLIPRMGPLGAAFAVVASDLLIQLGVLGLVVMRQILQRPFTHLAYLAGLMLVVTLGGWALGTAIREMVGGSSLFRFALECAIWLAVVAIVCAPLLSARLREKLIDTIPR
jgi:O-antigen/teichoic acid export membrane protein